ncbi:hypothetical protein CDO52_00190 [Nocardiopsis gilva YIM 90087]|uniref:HK97 gp10 family phage protein n=1 Tax=Nocardiopsis gilva YIM 90087 TaxID=1235441 RepID=A0A223RZY6_9ACTN|nr:DUF5403 family protein [Nocardiopsis gilva]ASU81407.1 hypothetical protein CDO52_00190 [Nocardiopsis gilva YIM 90087]
MAQVFRGVERIAAHLAADAAEHKAEQLATRARMVLSAHRHTGRAQITVTTGARSDAFVNLNDPGGNALAIEFGRTATSSRGPSQGVYALHRAIGQRGG